MMRSIARYRATRGKVFLALVLALAALGPAAATADAGNKSARSAAVSGFAYR